MSNLENDEKVVETEVVTEQSNEGVAVKENFFERKFQLKKNGTNLKTEVMAGLTTFMAMVYILMVNAGMFAELGVVSYGAMYIVTALSAIIGTVLIGLLSGLPLAQAPGMGLNAFFVYTMCFTFGFSYANTLVFILLDGLVFVALTVTGLRKKIFGAIPETIKKAIPAGIGLFIAFIGLQNAKLVIPSASTGVTMGSMNLLADHAWASLVPLFVVVLGVIAIAAMSKKNVKGAILLGILGSAVLYYAMIGLGAAFGDESSKAVFAAVSMSNPFDAFKEFGTQAFGKVFTEGFNFSGYIDTNGVPDFILMLITSALAFCLVDMFDTLGTLYGACKSGNLLDEKGDVPNLNKAMLADAVATTAGAILGTSTVTTFVESSAGTAAGGKTALTSYVVTILFAVAMFLSPIAHLIPSCGTATALIYVGVLMINNVRDIEWSDPAVALPAFLTVAMMPFTYNISFGIGFGLLSYVIIKLCTGKAKEVSVATYVLTAIFLAMFLFTH
ncbi:MAG: NCS2 family permease [Clostridia bacterium]|nr:NCS2 family permease [Clostridia bacterium]